MVERVMDEHEQRAAVVREALSWLGTPYHHMGRIKGAGVDCGMLLLEVFEACGLIPHVDPGHYPHDWHLHRTEARYLAEVEQHGARVDGPPKPGDLVLYRYGRTLAHGAIVVEWPTIIHAYIGRGVILDDAQANQELVERQAGFWSIWGGGEA